MLLHHLSSNQYQVTNALNLDCLFKYSIVQDPQREKTSVERISDDTFFRSLQKNIRTRLSRTLAITSCRGMFNLP
jgi:hypothetical protein